jgi:16S rRNA (adenine1518-N6/adenine1519-N6)-dimethyltransferase
VRRRAAPRLGQHFLIDDNLLGVIGRLADAGPDDIVLEVGPGEGTLTTYLADRVGHVHAVEVDRTLAPKLEAALAPHPNVSLRFEDALALDPATLKPSPTKLISNLPYSVATPIVVESLDRLPSIEHWAVMVQREVADRFFASPSTKAYGAVSVLLQLVTSRTGFHPVSRTVFRPRPHVDSALVGFSRVALPENYPAIRALVVAAFAHRRKTLLNSLELAGHTTRERGRTALDRLDLPPDVRAEALRPGQFADLARALE